MTTLPEEAAFAAAKAITGPLRDPTEWELEQFKRALIAALPFLSVQGAPANACQCTKIQQDETCPVGYPSLLCEICDGKGVVQPSSARELALEEAAKNCEREAAEVEGLIDDVAYHLRKRAAAIRALSSPDHADAGKVEGDGWKPIESAPKDGTPVLIAWQAVASVRGEKQWFQTVAHYDDSFEIAGYDEETGDADKRGAWTDGAVASWAYEEIREISPTHWRRLPSAPASEGSNA